MDAAKSRTIRIQLSDITRAPQSAQYTDRSRRAAA
jgi:hypothetical protein